jgi:hypothetical protein
MLAQEDRARGKRYGTAEADFWRAQRMDEILSTVGKDLFCWNIVSHQ